MERRRKEGKKESEGKEGKIKVDPLFFLFFFFLFFFIRVMPTCFSYVPLQKESKKKKSHFFSDSFTFEPCMLGLKVHG